MIHLQFFYVLYPVLLVDFLQNISLFLGIVLEYERTFPPPSLRQKECMQEYAKRLLFSIETRWDARTRIAKRVRSLSEEKVFKRLRWDH